MAIELRTGTYGEYYGSIWGTSESISREQREVNAVYIYKYLHDKGWTLNAVCGVLGNMQHESGINPGRWQDDNVGVGPAYGLVQWDKYTKYTEWAVENGWSDPSEMDANLARIMTEFVDGTGGQYTPTANYPETRKQFMKSKKDAYYLACAFAWNYEKSAVVLWGTEEKQENLRKVRGGCAEDWYDYLLPIDPGGSEEEKKRGLSLLLMYAATRRCV